VVSLQAEVASLKAQLAAVQAENVELRARLNRNSQNSSKPPSTDPPGVRPSPGKHDKKWRKRGGQPGHQRRLPSEPEHIDHVKQYRPSTCKHCQTDLAKGRLTGTVLNHHVYELPESRPIVTDHQCLDVECPKCGLVTSAELPPEVPRGNYGPSVQAMTALLRGELRQSVRQTSSVMTKLMHVPLSTGMVAKTQDQVSRALAAPYQQMLAYVQRSDLIHADETGWREDKKKAWLWVAVAGIVTLFLVHPKRSAKAAKTLIGEKFKGILNSDRWVSYNWIDTARRQLCWSHLKRDFKSFLDYGLNEKRLGERLLAQRRKLFRHWQRIRDGTMSRAEFQLVTKPVQRKVVSLLEEGTGLSSRKVTGMCREILKLKAALFTFVEIEGVEPTNNVAERAIRFAVLMRKGCFGSDSARGSRFIERFLTVRATLRSQQRDLYTYLKDACTAALHGTAPPSLLSNHCCVPEKMAVAM
jgi:transposase